MSSRMSLASLTLALAVPVGMSTAPSQAAAQEAGAAQTAPAPDEATSQADAEQLMDSARQTLQQLGRDDDFTSLRSGLGQAHAVLVFPKVRRAGLVVGGEGGTGVLFVRNQDGTWHGPAFYTLSGASLGLQAGASSSEVVLLIQSRRTLESLYRTSVKVGADAGVVLGARGRARTAVASDMVVYARTQGVFAGASLQGAFLSVRDGLNQAYYGRPVTPIDILVTDTAVNPQAQPMLAALRDLSSTTN